MAVMTSAIANGGKVLWPRLVEQIQSMDPTDPAPPIRFDAGRIRDQLGVSLRTLDIVRRAMYSDVQDRDGTGTEAFIQGFPICGKTGTAQKKNISNQVEQHITWFASFAPYDQPRWAVVVMVEVEKDIIGSGARTCAPIAKKIYEAIRKREQMRVTEQNRVARAN